MLYSTTIIQYYKIVLSSIIVSTKYYSHNSVRILDFHICSVTINQSYVVSNLLDKTISKSIYFVGITFIPLYYKVVWLFCKILYQ